MRLFYILIVLILLIWACSSPKSVVKVELNEVVAASDSTAYELLTFDSKFESWYVLQNSPAKFRSQSYYESWNRQYVSAWNFNAVQSSKSNFFEPIVGYEPQVDYGFEINHKLFHYFQYVENVLKIEIMPNGPKAVQF
jgi:Family of unknown function (DUF6146)